MLIVQVGLALELGLGDVEVGLRRAEVGRRLHPGRVQVGRVDLNDQIAGLDVGADLHRHKCHLSRGRLRLDFDDVDRLNDASGCDVHLDVAAHNGRGLNCYGFGVFFRATDSGGDQHNEQQLAIHNGLRVETKSR